MNSSPAFGPSAKPGSIGAIESDAGTRHGSDEFARKVSDRSTTGVRYLTAIRAASIAASKQPDGVDGAMIGSGDSPWRPYIAASRSDCSVLVGRPVDGPARWTSTITIGSSSITARPIVSLFRSSPGPDVA